MAKTKVGWILGSKSSLLRRGPSTSTVGNRPAGGRAEIFSFAHPLTSSEQVNDDHDLYYRVSHIEMVETKCSEG